MFSRKEFEMLVRKMLNESPKPHKRKSTNKSKKK